MKNYNLFIIIILFIIVINNDKQIMIDYIINSNKYINLYCSNKKFKFIKIFLFKIIFFLLFLIYPFIALINSIKNFSIKNFYNKIKHPITIFDPNLSSYNIFPHKKYFNLLNNKPFWLYLFKYYKIPFKDTNYNQFDNLIKIQTSHNKVLYTYYNNLEFTNEILIDVKTNVKYKNIYIEPDLLNKIQILCVKLHKKLSSEFKIIEWYVIIEGNEFYFHSGNINTKLIQSYDSNYIPKYKQLMKLL